MLGYYKSRQKAVRKPSETKVLTDSEDFTSTLINLGALHSASYQERVECINRLWKEIHTAVGHVSVGLLTDTIRLRIRWIPGVGSLVRDEVFVHYLHGQMPLLVDRFTVKFSPL